MDAGLKTALSQQFLASIDTLGNAMRACPDELWEERLWDTGGAPPVLAQFWYITFHTLFWLDLYLQGAVEGFMPPAPYTLDELDPAGVAPEKPYTRAQLFTYLDFCRDKCKAVIENLTAEAAYRTCAFPWGEMSFVGLLLYNMRHVQEHAAQMNQLLGQKSIHAPGWVTGVKRPPLTPPEPDR